MDTTAESFRITLAQIASSAQRLELLADDDGLTLAYRHNGAGHPPYVYAIAADGSTDDAATSAAAAFLPEFTHKFTRRESMAALEACQRALYAAARAARGASPAARAAWLKSFPR